MEPKSLGSALPGLTQASVPRGAHGGPTPCAGRGAQGGARREGAGKSSVLLELQKTQVLLILNLVESQVDTGSGHQTPADLIPPQPKSRTQLDRCRAPDVASASGAG